MKPDPAEPTAAARAGAANLGVDHATAEVLRAFDAAGVRNLLLKGPSIARWLYGAGEPRSYNDSDLLVRPSDVMAAEHVLANMGYAPQLDERRMPVWWQEHACGWLKADESSLVDLHRTLQGIGVDAERAWAVLSRETDTLEVAGFSATVLSIPARALYIVLHASHHGPCAEPLRDLERALAQVPEDRWGRAVALAVELDATDSLVAGLQLRPEGRALAARLGLRAEPSVEVALRSAGARPESVTVDRIARAPGPRERIGIVIHKLFPPATFVRFWSPLARRGRLGLGLAYGYRVLWVAKKAVPALAAWWRARRHVVQRDDG